MCAFLQSLRKLYTNLSSLINNLLKPNPKYTKTTLEQEIVHKRNKAVFLTLNLVQLIYIYDVFINQGPILENLVRSFAAIFMIALLIISCRYHPQIFKFFYFFTCIVLGPMTLNSGMEGISTAYIFVNILPIFTQVMTGSYTYYIIIAIAQTIFLNTHYQKPLGELIASNSPELVLKYFTYSANVVTAMQVTLVILIDRSLAQAQHQAFSLEQKKNEAENQKVFLLGFSHELRNLINSLTGNVKLASLENAGGRIKDLLLNAEVCGELLLHLINNILDTGKAEIGELEMNLVPTKTYEMFERIWGICSELIKRKDLGGRMKVPKNLPQTIITDNHRLTQIFLNLVGNSIKFTDKGSIDITVEWIEGEEVVNEKCFQPYPYNTDEQDEGLFEKQQDFSVLSEDYVVLNTVGRRINKDLVKTQHNSSPHGILKMVVSDRGCGMTKEQTNKLFQKFTQVTNDVAKKKLGTGLGLFITKQLCQKMNGEVRVFSQKDKGSSFIFCLPVKVLQETSHVIDDQESLKKMLASKKLRAMIVDDAPANHFVLGAFFEKLGIKIMDIAVNGLEAAQKYSSHAVNRNYPDIVAMDLDMPIMNGKEASQKIRELEKQNKLKPCFLIIISGNCLDSEIGECLDKGGKIRADIFLRKPLKLEDLTRIIASQFIHSER